jgi:hypothetical protein
VLELETSVSEKPASVAFAEKMHCNGPRRYVEVDAFRIAIK